MNLPDYKLLQQPLLDICLANQIRGTVLLAEEGINGTISGDRSGIDKIMAFMKSYSYFADINHKESRDSNQPFHRMKVRLKKEIVTLGVNTVDPNTQVGCYVKPQDWNALITNPDVMVIDTRNSYEVDIGSFKQAINPKTSSFREFPEYISAQRDTIKTKKIAMFCTGGIRCEKASSFMLQQGFTDIYHLQGGILNYLQEIPAKDSLWEGECFVFDNRVTVDQELNKGHYDLCHACRHPIDSKDQESPSYKKGISCPYCIDNLNEKTRQRATARQRQMTLAKERNEQHIGMAEEVGLKSKQKKQQRRYPSRKMPLHTHSNE